MFETDGRGKEPHVPASRATRPAPRRRRRFAAEVAHVRPGEPWSWPGACVVIRLFRHITRELCHDQQAYQVSANVSANISARQGL